MSPLSQEIINILKWRTRNIFIDPFYIFFWDLLPRFRRRRYLPVLRPAVVQNILPITMITYNRPFYFEKTLSSFIEKNKPTIEKMPIIINVQGKNEDKETNKIIKKYEKYIHRVITPGVNLGCAAGYSLLMAETLKLRLPYVVHLQDDFVSLEPLSDYLSELSKLLDENKDVGFIRLRTTQDKVNDHNVISRRKIKYKKIVKNLGIGNGHFTFNPTIARASVIEKIIPTHSEKDAQEKYQKLGLKSGQLFGNCFSHIGHERAENWIK